jgi:O-antigen ligase
VGLLLPLHWSNMVLILFIISSFFTRIIAKKSMIPTRKQLFFAGFFLLFPMALLYTENSAYGVKVLERNLVWFLIPLIIPLGLNFEKNTLYKILRVFSIAIHILVFGLVLLAIWKYIDTKDSLVFYYDQLTEVIHFHPVYLSVYLLFGMLILIDAYRKKMIRIPWYFGILVILLDFVFLVLLSSKTVLLSFLLVFLILVFRELKSKKQILTAVLGILLFVVGITQFSETKNRINDSLFSSWELLDKETFLYNDPFTGITLRLITWKFVMNKFIQHENALLGVGTGDATDYIDRVYIDRNMDEAGYLGFNLHNQYLEYFLKFGLIGLIYFGTILFLSFQKAIKDRNGLYFSFLVIFCIFSITESNLEVQRGIVFFVLINSLFYFFTEIKEHRSNE